MSSSDPPGEDPNKDPNKDPYINTNLKNKKSKVEEEKEENEEEKEEGDEDVLQRVSGNKRTYGEITPDPLNINSNISNQPSSSLSSLSSSALS